MTTIKELFDNFNNSKKALEDFLMDGFRTIDPILWEHDPYGPKLKHEPSFTTDFGGCRKINDFRINGSNIRFLWNENFFEIPIVYFDDASVHVEEAIKLKNMTEEERSSYRKSKIESEKEKIIKDEKARRDSFEKAYKASAFVDAWRLTDRKHDEQP